MAEPERYDAVVLGSGEGGKYLAWHLAQAGQRVAVVERRWIGGSCPNINCLPSKNEIWSANVADLVRHAAQFGITTGPVAVDMEQGAAAQARHGRRPDRDAPGPLPGQRRRADHGLRALRGAEDARGAPERRRQRVLAGERVFLNVGTHATIPDVPGLAAAEPLTHIEALELGRLPVAPARPRRRIRRPRARPGVPTLRQPGHDRQSRSAARGPRGPRRLG